MAKSGLLPAATTVLLLLLVSLSSADMDSDVVVDMEGKAVEVSAEYYIQPVNTGIFRGGIRRAPTPDDGSSCPVYAIQSPSHNDKGRPVMFIPQNETQNEIREKYPVRIDSGFNFNCIEDGHWRLNYESTQRRTVIIASGALEIPRSRFVILKVEDSLGPSLAYKIALDSNEPSPDLERPTYKYLTLFRALGSGMIMVGLTENTDEALRVQFIKKHLGTTITSYHSNKLLIAN